MTVELQLEDRERMGGDASESGLVARLASLVEQVVLCTSLVTDYESEMSGRPGRGVLSLRLRLWGVGETGQPD